VRIAILYRVSRHVVDDRAREPDLFLRRFQAAQGGSAQAFKPEKVTSPYADVVPRSKTEAKMTRNETMPVASKHAAMRLRAAPLASAAVVRLLGLNAGDWSTLFLSLVLSGLLLAFI
jgi:hypothetical protein